jgi:hypothetical protein
MLANNNAIYRQIISRSYLDCPLTTISRRWQVTFVQNDRFS